MKDHTQLDLNLLKLFASLFDTASVTDTAQALNLSQSACSHALQRLRERCDDPLFVRIDKRMLPTAYAVRLAESVLPALQQIDKGLASSATFCAQSEQRFRIAATDYAAWCMRDFCAHLSQCYEHISVEFVQLDERLPQEALQSAEIDLICGIEHDSALPESLCGLHWFEDDYLCLRSTEHTLKNPLTLDDYLACEHVLVTPWNEPRGVVDLGLSKLRKKRRVAIKMASLLAAPYFIPSTDYLLALPRRYAEQIAPQLGLRSCELPFVMPNYQLSLYWHKTYDRDPKLRWFVDTFAQFYHLKP
ncbi:MAG: LysR family transcriptional regulator [Pseudomonadales bacterium]